MTRRERLRRCYYNEELDRPGVYSRTGFPADDPTYERLRSYLLAHTELKRGWSSSGLDSADPTDSFTEPHSEDWCRRTTVLHTPAGDLTCSSLASLTGLPGLHQSFYVNCRGDAETFLSQPMPEIGGEVASFFAARKEIGDAGIVDVGLGFNPAGYAAELCGSATFAVLSVTDRGIVHALCQRRMEVLLARTRYLLEREVGPFFSMLGEEYVVPPLHGPEDFYDFNVRYDKPVIDLIHESGGRSGGDRSGLLKEVGAYGHGMPRALSDGGGARRL